jgi:hypothetical protein
VNAFTILVLAFVSVTLIGFAAARSRPAEDPMHLNEWGLGGRGFGTFVSWFLLIWVPVAVLSWVCAGHHAHYTLRFSTCISGRCQSCLAELDTFGPSYVAEAALP